jgi:peptidoglycan/LPS O-acetylase OafA/YrhL
LIVDVYHHFAWTRHHHRFWLQVLLAAAFLIVLIRLSSQTYPLVKRPIRNVGRQAARWLDSRLGPDRAPGRLRPAEPAMAGGTHPS